RRPSLAALVVAAVASVSAGACRRPTPPVAGAADAAATGGAAPTPKPKRPKRIDVHTHISPDGIERSLKIMDEWGIDGMVNLSGMYPGPPRNALETQLGAARQSMGRIAVFTTPDFRVLKTRKDWGAALAEQLAEARKAGAIGLKISKGLGLGFP